MAKMTLKQILEMIKAFIEALLPVLPAIPDVVQGTEPTTLVAVVCAAGGQDELNGEFADALAQIEAEFVGKIDPAKWQALLKKLAEMLALILPLIT